MKILHVINGLASGGAEVFVGQLCAASAKANEVALLTYAGILDSRGEEIDAHARRAGVEVVHLNVRSNARKVGVPVSLARYLRQFGPDVVNVHLDQSEVLTALALPQVRPRPIALRTLHSCMVFRRSARVLAPLLRATYDWTVACGAGVAEALSPVLTPGRTSVIPNGIDTSLFNAAASCTQSGSTPLTFVSIGSMTPRAGRLPKAQDVLLRAYARSGLAGRVRLVFAGDGLDRFALEVLGRQLKLDHLTFAGYVHDVRGLLMNCDAVVLPSRFEGLPIAAIEAACAGKPLLTSSIPAFDDFRETAVSCAPDDVDALSDALKQLVVDYETLAYRARQKRGAYVSQFDISATALRYAELYQRLLA